MIARSGGTRIVRVNVTRNHPARKVAEITLGFWLAKVVATTLGEVAGDAIAQTLNLGYVAGLAITLHAGGLPRRTGSCRSPSPSSSSGRQS
ncbi:hypothetical protein [Sphingomonas aerolata]|uniref:hypothetical protein n=1 Tax=Sphingomonas aerolata TaxID=185951 RepID=UPI003A5C1D5E